MGALHDGHHGKARWGLKASAFVLVLASAYTLTVEAVPLKRPKRGICVSFAHIERRRAIANLHALHIASGDADVGEEVFERVLVKPMGFACVHMNRAIAFGFISATVTSLTAVGTSLITITISLLPALTSTV
jgi:hypothetical protein